MKKSKAITLLSIISFLMAVVLVFTFIKFPIGVSDYSYFGALELDSDIAGGTAYVYVLDHENNKEEVKDINKVVDTLEQRLTILGYENFVVKAVKSTDPDVVDYDIRIEIMESDSADSDISAVMKYGELKFFGGAEANPTEEIFEGIKVVDSAKYMGNPSGQAYQVNINFTKDAKDMLFSLIDANEEYYLEIKLGDDVLLSGSSAITKAYFNGNTIAVSSATEATARQMVMQITTGGLAYQYKLADNGEFSINSIYSNGRYDVVTALAIIVLCFFVILCVASIILFKGFGIAGSLSMLLFMLIELWMLLAVPGVVISLGSVLGILFANLLVFDGIILVGKRIKEELSKSQKTKKAATKKAFSTALLPTISVHVVAGVFALALLFLTHGAMRGFAVTFGIGVVVSALATLVFTRMFNALITPIVAKNTNLRDVDKEGL